MTTFQAIQFAAKVQIGTEIEMGRNCTLTVSEIGDKAFKGVLKIGGKLVDNQCFLSFETLTNPHYNQNLKVK